jgi:hypothetical protein
MVRLLYSFYHKLQGFTSCHPTLADVWDSNPPCSQWSCMYTVMMDINQLLEYMILLVNPLNGDKPLRLAKGHDPDSPTHRSLIALVSPHYQPGMEPLDIGGYQERPNLLSAIASWDERTRRYYQDICHIHANNLTPAPAFTIAGGGRKLSLPAALQHAPQCQELQTGHYTSNPRQNPISGDPAPTQGKTPNKARTCLLRYQDGVRDNQRTHGPGNLFEPLSEKPKFPAFDATRQLDGKSDASAFYLQSGTRRMQESEVPLCTHQLRDICRRWPDTIVAPHKNTLQYSLQYLESGSGTYRYFTVFIILSRVYLSLPLQVLEKLFYISSLPYRDEFKDK